MLVRIVCHIPQKQHFYAGLTASISRQYDQLAKRIIDTALATLQDTLNNGKVYESINLLHYFGELMNVSLLNSLALLNLLEDIVAYAE